jgi:hypothetical protein
VLRQLLGEVVIVEVRRAQLHDPLANLVFKPARRSASGIAVHQRRPPALFQGASHTPYLPLDQPRSRVIFSRRRFSRSTASRRFY